MASRQLAGVLGHFGRAHAHDDDFFAAAGIGGVQGLQELARTHVVRADHDAVRLEEVVDRVAFLEELRIGHHVEFNGLAARGQFPGDELAHLVGRSHRHGGFVHDNLVIPHAGADVPGHLVDVGQVAGTVLTGGSAHGDEDEQRVLHAFGHLGGEAQPTLGDIPLDQFIETRLINVDFAHPQVFDDGGIGVHTADIIAHLGETGGAHQADVTGAHDTKIHTCARC